MKKHLLLLTMIGGILLSCDKDRNEKTPKEKTIREMILGNKYSPKKIITTYDSGSQKTIYAELKGKCPLNFITFENNKKGREVSYSDNGNICEENDDSFEYSIDERKREIILKSDYLNVFHVVNITDKMLEIEFYDDIDKNGIDDKILIVYEKIN